MRVSFAAAAALRRDESLANLLEILDHEMAIRIGHHGPGWNGDDDVVGTASRAVRASPPLTRVGPPTFPMRQRRQAVGAFMHFHDDATTATSIAAVGTSMRNVLLPTKARAAVSAVPTLNLDDHSIDKHNNLTNVRL